MLDIDFVRSQFPAFSEPSLKGQAFFENAGGSYACQQTIDRLTRYYKQTKVQPKHPHSAGMIAMEAMDTSRLRWAAALGVTADELQFGPSTSANTYVLAQAFGQMLPKDAEVIVTNQDHEANSGAMRRMAELHGLTLKEWQVNPDTGQLEIEALQSLLSDKTMLVCFPHCSNLIGQTNPVEDWVKLIKSAPRKPYVIVDGVSHVPHGLPNVAALGCDIYVFSLYKVYSVHQGLMVVRKDALDALPNQGHHFNSEMPNKRLTPAGPDHGQEASAQGVLDYIELLDRHHGCDGQGRAAIDRVNKLWADHETQLKTPILDFLSARNDLRLLGQTDPNGRHGTIAFSPAHHSAHGLAKAMGEKGFGLGSGHFYSARVLEAMGFSADKGVTRLSLVHNNSLAEVQGLLEALDAVL